MLVRKPCGRSREPGLDDDGLQLDRSYALQADEDRGVAVEVGSRKKDSWVLGQQCFLVTEVRDHCAENEAFGRLVTKCFEVSLAQRSFPDEQLVFHTPLEVAARLAFARLG